MASAVVLAGYQVVAKQCGRWFGQQLFSLQSYGAAAWTFAQRYASKLLRNYPGAVVEVCDFYAKRK